MKAQASIIGIAVAALALTPALAFAKGGPGGPGAGQPKDRAQVERGQRDMDRDRLHDRDRISNPQKDRDRIQDRTHAPDNAKFGDRDIYGGAMMTEQERNQYREQLRLIGSDEQKRTRFLAQHREKMQTRAKAKGIALDDKDDSGPSE